MSELQGPVCPYCVARFYQDMDPRGRCLGKYDIPPNHRHPARQKELNQAREIFSEWLKTWLINNG